MSAQVVIGDCVEAMRGMADESVDAVVCDPPYGLEFMGKEWDSFESKPRRVEGTGGSDAPFAKHAVALTPARNNAFQEWCEGWARECLRVLKPGGYLLAFGGTRTYHRMACAIEDAGFEIRDSLHWIYGSGFPKSLNLGDGRGSALKPAHEPIVMARRPLIGTLRANVLEHGTGALNIDGCRIASDGSHFRAPVKGRSGGMNAGDTREGAALGMFEPGKSFEPTNSPLGRWPANVLFSHLPECRCVGTRKVKGSDARKADGTRSKACSEGWSGLADAAERQSPPTYAGEDGLEEVEQWECAPGCPVAELDRQSGTLKGRANKGPSTATSQKSVAMGTMTPRGSGAEYNYDLGGGASRFFYVAKPSRRERDAGCEALPERTAAECVDREPDSAGMNSPRAGAGRTSGARNFHPTVKPIQLMRYLVRLVTPPNGIVLDPFCGSGTTGIACVQEGFGFIGIEREAEYAEIARARIENAARIDKPDSAQRALPFERAE